MKSLFALLFFLRLTVPLAAQSPTFHPADLNWIADQEAKARQGKLHPPELAPTDDYDVLYQRMQWQIDPAVRYIQGAITTYFSAKTADFGTVHFDLMDIMTVDSVRYHGAAVAFNHSANIVTIPLPALLSLDARDSVTVFYQGVPPETGFGSFIQSSHENVPIIWTLSEPYGARDWWPCKQDLSDKIDSIDVSVTCPATYRSAGNGLLVSEIDNGSGLKSYHWKHRYPIACYLVAIAVTNYAQYYDYAEITTGTLPILNYVYPENLAQAQMETPQVVPVLEFYDSLFVPYPFHKEKYGHAQFGWGGGQEHQTMTFLVNFGYELMAHELGHQWFGDYITCGSWQDIWLNEGFATYLSGLCYERFGSAQNWYNFKQGRISSVVSQPNGSVWVDDTTNVGRIFNGRLSYAKGGMVLHMLRWTLGDDIFFAGVRNYLTTPGLAGDFARTTDLRTVLETASGQDLNGFFNDWIYGQGYPSYHIDWSQSGNDVMVTIAQSQSDPSVPFFEVPVPLRLRQGNQSFDIRLNPTASGQTFQLTIPFTADVLEFDPELWLISANNTVTKTVVGTREAPFASANIFPNPVTNRATVSLGAGAAFERVRVFNNQGQAMLDLRMDPVTETELDLAGLPAGMYVLEIYGKAGIAIGKVIRQ